MSAPRELARFDFRHGSGLATSVLQRLLPWTRNICAAVPESWGKYLRGAPTLEHLGHESHSLAEARLKLPETGLAYRCDLSDAGPVTLVVLPRLLALALVRGMLGEVSEGSPTERELTAVEHSFCDLLMEEFCQAVGDAWPEQQPLTCRLMGRQPKPRRTRLFAPTEQMLLLSFELGGTLGPHEVCWVFPRKAIEEFFALHAAEEKPPEVPAPSLLAQRVLDVPAELRVKLGESQLDVGALARLRVGDVVILNQRIADPLTASVAGAPKFIGWPGRVGLRQAFQVGNLLETSPRRAGHERTHAPDHH